MATTDDESNPGQTTLELTRLDDGRWRATQAGVATERYGQTDALAAMDYCRRVAEGGDDE
ncbi:hypothetical protein [Halomicrococcus gelatinilyticus]|uniref:hypothetical protein n=1 Tax=Halomicrococcus gelatinilyticus TaxID=1702103 RepID=UPI002E12AE29